MFVTAIVNAIGRLFGRIAQGLTNFGQTELPQVHNAIEHFKDGLDHLADVVEAHDEAAAGHLQNVGNALMSFNFAKTEADLARGLATRFHALVYGDTTVGTDGTDTVVGGAGNDTTVAAASADTTGGAIAGTDVIGPDAAPAN